MEEEGGGLDSALAAVLAAQERVGHLRAEIAALSRTPPPATDRLEETKLARA